MGAGHRAIKKYRCEFGKLVGAFGGKIPAMAVFSASTFYLGMAVEVVGETIGDYRALCDYFCRRGCVFAYFVVKQWVVGATKYHGVDVGLLVKESVDVLLYEVVSSRRVGFSVLDKWNPHGACLGVGRKSGMQFGNFHVVALTFYRAWCAEYANIAIG